MSQEEECKVYGVLGISDEIVDIVQMKLFLGLPALVKTAILPFKDKIIWDGLLRSYNVIIGQGMKRSLNEEYKLSKAKYGIIDSLPFEIDKESLESRDEKMLEYYLSTKENRECYCNEIEDIASKSDFLFARFYQIMGKINSRRIKKALKEEQIKGHFAVLYEAVVASGSTKKKLEENIRDIVPGDKMDLIYRFRIK